MVAVGGRIWPRQTDLITRIVAGEPAALAELFAKQMAACTAYYYDEGPFDELLASASGVTPEVCFTLIPATVDIVIAERDGSRIESALTLLLDLVRASNTTELPARLQVRWEDIGQVANGVSPRAQQLWRWVAEWYRRPAQEKP